MRDRDAALPDASWAGALQYSPHVPGPHRAIGDADRHAPSVEMAARVMRTLRDGGLEIRCDAESLAEKQCFVVLVHGINAVATPLFITDHTLAA